MSSARSTASNVTVRLGLISFHVDMMSALHSKQAKAKTASKTMVCPTCHGVDELHALKQKFVCEHDANHGPFAKADAVMALVVDGEMLPTALETVAELTETEERSDVELTVHPAVDVEAHTLVTGNIYRLKPRDNEAQYALMVELVSSPSVAFIAEWTNKGATLLYRLVVHGGLLMMTELARPDRVSEPFAAPSLAFDEKLLDQGKNMVERACEPFDPADWQDRRKARLLALAERLGAAAPVTGAVSPAADTAADLLELLARSVDAAAA